MTNDDKQRQENEDILEEMETELEEIQDEEGQIDEEKLEEVLEGEGELEDPLNSNSPDGLKEKEKSKDDETYRDKLIKVQADFDNYKKRVARDRDEMIFFLKSDILTKVLPRIDDLERIIKNTPADLQQNPLFEGVISILTKLLTDLEKLGVKPFSSIGEKVNPLKHEVMTVVPGKEADVVFDEFEKGYLLGDKVLRPAKVIVGGE